MKKIGVFLILLLLFGIIFSTASYSQSLTKKTVYIYTNVVSKVYISGHYKGFAKYKYKDKDGVMWYYIKLSLKVGIYPLKLEAKGYKTRYEKIKVTSSGKNRFFYKLKKEEISKTTTTPELKGVGKLVINTDVDAWVYLNNIKLGKTPFNKKIKAGYYKLLVVPFNTKYPKKSLSIKIENGRTTSFNFKFIQHEVLYEIKINANTTSFVYVNGVKQNHTTPITLKLKKGYYKIKLVPIQPFYMSYTTTLNVYKNNTYNFNLPLKTLPVTFEIPKNAILYIDNKKIKFNSSSFKLYLLPGPHKIKIIYYDFVIEKDFTVNFNKPLKISLFMDIEVEQEE